MVILITGDRTYKNRRKVWKEIYKRRKKVKFVIEGGAKGADMLAYECAMLLGIQPITVDANWDKFKKAAGPIRNHKMLELLMSFKDKKLVLAFHPNLEKSKGTKDMVSRAKKAGLLVKVIK